jgi:hypothetical protein
MKKRTRKGGTTAPNQPSEPTPGHDELLERIRTYVPHPSRSDADAQAWLDAYDDEDVDLPYPLSDPTAAVELIFGAPIPLPDPGPGLDDAVSGSLRRAARNGREITPGVEDAMRRAREEAEGDATQDG